MIPFYKYHGLGNDFIIINDEESMNYHTFAQVVCHRQLGIGADGLIVVKQHPLEMLFFNQDGSQGTMCGNGLRCFARHVVDDGLQRDATFNVLTKAGEYVVAMMDDLIQIEMGKPDFSPLRMDIDTTKKEWINETMDGVLVSAVFTGTTHGVVFVDDLDAIVMTDMGYQLHQHPLFKSKANINFVQVINSQHFRVTTYERGVGWTLACGTGACASFVIGERLGYCQKKVRIEFKYGSLQIEFNEQGHVLMTGPATLIAKGEFIYENKK